ncbi:inosine/xanthosine triphosphatase [Rapidithrix thailandica]|uniref:Probable inosine/xanthosine triphosphatase n=1 Tax=Rapidithrix thailandica TaxID=413964 RepID=A0AAW9SIH3_9BACT
MKKIIVASKNPVKVNATQQAFVRMFPDEQFEVMGCEVESGVNDQPFSNEETFKGAVTRARNAQGKYHEADYWVGIEGGVEKSNHGMLAFAWIYVISKDEQTGQSKTGAFYLPKEVVYLVEQGIELGKATDAVFNQDNSKQKGGAVGVLTHGELDRTEYYQHAVVLALIPLVNPKLY